MLQSRLIGDTHKEWPSEASIKSHGLLIKGGYIKQMASGIYTLMPLGKKVISKIENIVREEMNNIGAQEVLMPIVATKKLWDMSKRYDTVGSELLRFKDRNNTEMVLSMTHEEAAVFATMSEATSYQKYPFSIYQIQTKFRDEARPRAGLIRVREFTMKDAYSFHTSNESLDKVYDEYYEAYNRIYARVGLEDVVAVAADTGMMGGTGAHEYMLLCDAGEDKIVICNNCNYSANMEVAYTNNIESYNNEESNLELVSTPNIKEVDELCKTMNIHEHDIMKAVVYKRTDNNTNIIVFIRGDREVNETKLRNLIKVDDECLVPSSSNDKDDIVYGFIGPKDLNIKDTQVLYDKSLQNEKSLVCGSNKIDYHYRGLNISRDVGNVEYVDISKVKNSDTCPICSKRALTISNGIEVGNIFKLGTKYTEIMKMTYLDENGKSQNPIMGCYGIGIGRLMASVLEKRGTENKVNWPASIAPFDIHICTIDYTKNEEIRSYSNELYNELSSKYDVLLDDRNKSAGVKFADSDLIGAAIRILISPRNMSNSKLEVKLSSDDEAVLVDKENIQNYIIDIFNKLK